MTYADVDDAESTTEHASVTVFLQPRAFEGAANDTLVALLAKHFRVTNVNIVRGHTATIKHLHVDRA
jgi:hypothetical protein